MKSKYTFETMMMDDTIVAVPVGDNATELSAVLRINEEAAAILKLLEQDTTEDKIVDALGEQFSGDRQEMAQYVHEYIQTLIGEGIVEA